MLFLLTSYFYFAQGGWKKKFYLQNGFTSVSQGALETPAGNFIVIGLTSDTINNKVFNRLTLIGTDSGGNFLWRKDYGGPQFVYLLNYSAQYAGISKDSTAFYFTGLVQDTAVREIGVLIKFNYSGDTIWQKIYRDPLEDVIPQNLTKSVEGGFLITGSFQNWNNNTNPCLLIKTAVNGNELWRKRIHGPSPDISDGNSIVQDSLTKKIIITGFQRIDTPGSSDIYSNILILDSLGNKILQTSLNNANGYGFESVIQLKDKNFLACGAWNEYSNQTTNFLKGFLVKFNINGLAIWSKKYFDPAVENKITFVEELENGDIVFLAGHDTIRPYDSTQVPLLSEFIRLELFKVDKNGNLLFKKYIGTPFHTNVYEYPSSLARTKDNGFIISSWFPNIANPQPYSIIKVDSTFCDTSSQWCISVALGISNFNKLSGYNFEMFPNPANDVLFLKTDSPIEKSIILKITELSGREIKTLQLISWQDIQLNTTEYKAGVYFVNVIYEGKTVDIRKLVIVR